MTTIDGISPGARRLLEQVIEAILAEPQGFDMAYWYAPSGLSRTCGTTACIAGWICQCAGQNLAEVERREDLYWDLYWGQIPAAARVLLNADPAYAPLELTGLFFADEWPGRFRGLIYSCPPGSRAYAELAAARIRYFIATNGTDIEPAPVESMGQWPASEPKMVDELVFA